MNLLTLFGLENKALLTVQPFGQSQSVTVTGVPKYFQMIKETSQIASVCKLTCDNLNSCTDIMLPILWSSFFEDGVPTLNPAYRVLIGL